MICDTCKIEVTPIPQKIKDAGGNIRVKMICPNADKYGFHNVRNKQGFYSNFIFDLDSMELAYDNSIPCDVIGCNEMGADLHHLAPRHIFGDEECEKYLKMNLCKTHHDLWHRLTNTGHYYGRVKNKFKIPNQSKRKK